MWSVRLVSQPERLLVLPLQIDSYPKFLTMLDLHRSYTLPKMYPSLGIDPARHPLVRVQNIMP